ncbi:MAG: TonB family protein [Bdellovibrionota bacterium]
MKKNNVLLLSLLLSIAFHAIFGAVLWMTGKFEFEKAREQSTVELMDPAQLAELMKRYQQPDLQGQIVEQDQQLNEEIDENARFMSKHNQKVVQQTQAALNGKFKNSADQGGAPKSQPKPGREEKEQSLTKTEEKSAEKDKPSKTLTSADGIATGKKPSVKDLTPSFRPGAPRVDSEDVAQGGGEGPSATDDHLDVKTGMQTMLTTREFVYYSYYNRIKDKLRQYWQPKIKEKVERIFRQGRTIASNGNKITKIIIVLDEKGVLQKVQVIGPSGVTDLDDAAVEAFRAAAPFPNPPNGIVDQDGLIKIRWDFILEASSSMFDPAIGVAKN